MDSDSSSKPINRPGSSSFLIRAPPSYDSDSENVIKSKRSGSSSSSSSSDGGFVSGEEDFETASERPLMDDPDEEIVDSFVGSDLIGKPFVGSSSLMPVAKVSSTDDDDNVGDDDKDDGDESYGVWGDPKVRVWRGEGVEDENDEGVLERVSEKVSTFVGELGSIITGGGGLFRSFGGGGSGDKSEFEGVGLDWKGVLDGEERYWVGTKEGGDVGGVEVGGGRGNMIRHLAERSEFEGVGLDREGISGGEERKGIGMEEEGGVQKGAEGEKVTGSNELGAVEGSNARANHGVESSELNVEESVKTVQKEGGVEKGAEGEKLLGNNEGGVVEGSNLIANRGVESSELNVEESAKAVQKEGGVEKGAQGENLLGNNEGGVVEGSNLSDNRGVESSELNVEESAKTVQNEGLDGNSDVVFVDANQQPDEEAAKETKNKALDDDCAIVVEGSYGREKRVTESSELKDDDTMKEKEKAGELKDANIVEEIKNEGLIGVGSIVFMEANQQPVKEAVMEPENEALDGGHALAVPTVEGGLVTGTNLQKSDVVVEGTVLGGGVDEQSSVVVEPKVPKLVAAEAENSNVGGEIVVEAEPVNSLVLGSSDDVAAEESKVPKLVQADGGNSTVGGNTSVGAEAVISGVLGTTVVGATKERKGSETSETSSLANGYDQTSREAEVPGDIKLVGGESVDLESKVNVGTAEPEPLVLKTVAGGVDQRKESVDVGNVIVDTVIEDNIVGTKTDASVDESGNSIGVNKEKSSLELGSEADSEAKQKEPISRILSDEVIRDADEIQAVGCATESTQANIAAENDGTLVSAQKVKEKEPGSEIASDEVSSNTDEILAVDSATESTEAIIAAENDGTPASAQDIGARSLESSERGLTANPEVKLDSEVEANLHPADDDNDEEDDGETDEVIFGSSAAAKQFMRELEQGSGADSSLGNLQRIDGQIATDSDEEVDTDEEGVGKELFDSAALSALLKAATGSGSGSDGGNITFTSPDGSKVFSLERPAGLGSSLRALKPGSRPIQPNIFRPSNLMTGGESGNNLSDEDNKKLEKVQEIRVKFLRLVQRLGHSPDDSIAAQVLYRLALVAGKQTNPLFNLDAAKTSAMQLEAEGKDDLDFSLNILVLGKTGVGKSATINSIFGEDKAVIDAFEPATATVKEISGTVDGVEIRVFDTPGLKSSVMEQAFNRKVLSHVKKFTKKCPPDIVLYVDRLDTQTRDLNDLPLLRSISSSLGSSIWRSVVVTLTHAASAPPDGPSGSPLSYDVFVSQRSNVVQQSIGQAVGDLRLMNPTVMNPVSLAENHPSCRKNREGQKVLPNGQAWRSQLLMLCYSMKILSEASSLSKSQDAFDPRKIFGIRARPPPLPYLLSSLLQSRAHPKLSTDQGGDNGDSDVDLDDLSDSDQEEEEDEYDQLPPFKPLKKTQVAKLSKEQRKAYFEEYDYRVKLLQKKQWREELKRMKEMKRRGKDAQDELGGYMGEDVDQENGTPSAVAVPLPDMVLPPSFDCDNPAYRYRFLEPTSQFLARPVLDTHGWDHDCGYDGVNLEQSLAIAGQFPAAISVQITKDKKEFNIHLDSSVAAKHGENGSSLAGFDIQTIGKQLAYILRGETKFKNFKKNKTAAGISLTFLGENVATGIKVEDQITIGKRVVLVGSTGTVRSQGDSAYGANLEVRLRESDFPIGQDQSTLGLSLIKWRGDLALGANFQSQFAIGRGSKMAVRVGLNNKLSGQISVRTSSSDQLQIALAGLLPIAISIYKSIWPGVSENYSIY